MAFRSSVPDLADRSERWDRERFAQEHDRDRHGSTRDRYEEEEDRYTTRGPPSRAPGLPRDRDRSVDSRFDRGPIPIRRPYPEDDDFPRERRRGGPYDDEPRVLPRRRLPSPDEYERRVMFERERERVRHSPSPPRRRPTTMLRRQSSLDTYDRRPRVFQEREEYGPPARRADYRPPPNMPIPLPRSKALPPPRMYAEREDDIQVSDPHRYGDEDFHAYPPEKERITEREIVHTRRRERSRDSESRVSRRTRSTRRSRSRSSSSSSSSSSSGGTSLTAKSEYPKKGKTRIPARLVSKRALIDLGYPFVEEGSTIIVQKALGQQNIDDLLRLSDDYIKSDQEVFAARSSAGDIIEERRTEIFEVTGPAQPVMAALPPPPQPVQYTRTPPPPPTYVQHQPSVVHFQQPAPPPPVEEYVRTTTVIRDTSPARSYTTGTSSYDTYSTTTGTTSTTGTSTTLTAVPPYVVDARPAVVEEHMPLVVHQHSRHGSLDDTESLRSEIRSLEKQLARRERSRHSRSRSRHHHHHGSGELVKAERLSTGELVLLEETVEHVEEPHRGVRIEKDKRGPPPKLMKAMLATLT